MVHIFPREEVDPDQNATTCYSKDNSRKPKSACELSQSTAYQSIVGYCSLETANSCNYDLMMRVDQREIKALKGSLWFIYFRETGEVDSDQNAVTGYSKDNSRKPKSPGELSQFFIYFQLRNNHSDLAVVKEFFLHSLN